jgi:hypothetical protein
MVRHGKVIDGELTRFEIVYVPDEKIPLDTLGCFEYKQIVEK